MLNRVFCLVRGGHDDMFAKNVDGKLVARCSRCGRESAGWDLSDIHAPVALCAGIPDRHRLVVKKVRR